MCTARWTAASHVVTGATSLHFIIIITSCSADARTVMPRYRNCIRRPWLQCQCQCQCQYDTQVRYTTMCRVTSLYECALRESHEAATTNWFVELTRTSSYCRLTWALVRSVLSRKELVPIIFERPTLTAVGLSSFVAVFLLILASWHCNSEITQSFGQVGEGKERI